MSRQHLYTRFFIRLVVGLGLLISLMVLSSLLIGAQSAGNSINAFTTTSYETTDVWIMDVSRMQFVHLRVNGHKNDIPVWSTQERQITFFPRTP
jgi:hypothetical protein